jgi:hypothetical protein
MFLAAVMMVFIWFMKGEKGMSDEHPQIGSDSFQY